MFLGLQVLLFVSGIFLNNRFISQCIEFQKILKTAITISKRPKWQKIACFVRTTVQNPKTLNVVMIKKKQLFEELEPVNVWPFFLINCLSFNFVG